MESVIVTEILSEGVCFIVRIWKKIDREKSGQELQ